MKKCNQCKRDFEKALIAGIEVDYCPRCYGMFFEENELRRAKDATDRDLRWLDIDLWRDEAKFRVARGEKVCPQDGMPMYEVRYGDSDVKVDICGICKGVWLDRGEFIEIIEYLKKKGHHEIMQKYTKTLVSEAWEVFSGPEMLREELVDVFTVLKLFQYKLAVQHPAISRFILALPKI
jgi:Zn-finger nucleic acid-binding protein